MNKKFIATTLLIAFAFLGSASTVWANCDPGEMVIKFSHVTNADRHPKGIAASLLAERVNAEMNGVACMEVFPYLPCTTTIRCWKLCSKAMYS